MSRENEKENRLILLALRLGRQQGIALQLEELFRSLQRNLDQLYEASEEHAKKMNELERELRNETAKQGGN